MSYYILNFYWAFNWNAPKWRFPCVGLSNSSKVNLQIKWLTLAICLQNIVYLHWFPISYNNKWYLNVDWFEWIKQEMILKHVSYSGYSSTSYFIQVFHWCILDICNGYKFTDIRSFFPQTIRTYFDKAYASSLGGSGLFQYYNNFPSISILLSQHNVGLKL